MSVAKCDMHSEVVKRQYQFSNGEGFEQASIEVLRVRKGLLLNAYEKFMSEILMVIDQIKNSSELQQFKQNSAAVEEMFIVSLALYEERIAKMEATVEGIIEEINVESEMDKIQSEEVNVECGKIQLKMFDGDYIYFEEWINEFNDKVHNNDMLSEDQKHELLLDALDGDAKLFFGMYTSENYTALYDNLVKKYKSEFYLAKALFERLDDLPMMQEYNGESVEVLIEMIRYIQNRLLQLSNGSVLYGEFWAIHTILKVIPNHMVTEFELKIPTEMGEIPSLESLITFLELWVTLDNKLLKSTEKSEMEPEGDEIQLKNGAKWSELVEDNDQVLQSGLIDEHSNTEDKNPKEFYEQSEIAISEKAEDEQVGAFNIEQPNDSVNIHSLGVTTPVERNQIPSKLNVFDDLISSENVMNRERMIKRCYHCNKPHKIYDCDEFKEMSMSNRIKRIEI